MGRADRLGNHAVVLVALLISIYFILTPPKSIKYLVFYAGQKPLIVQGLFYWGALLSAAETVCVSGGVPYHTNRRINHFWDCHYDSADKTNSRPLHAVLGAL